MFPLGVSPLRGVVTRAQSKNLRSQLNMPTTRTVHLNKWIHICKTDKTSPDCENFFLAITDSRIPNSFISSSEWIEVLIDDNPMLYTAIFDNPCGGKTTVVDQSTYELQEFSARSNDVIGRVDGGMMPMMRAIDRFAKAKIPDICKDCGHSHPKERWGSTHHTSSDEEDRRRSDMDILIAAQSKAERDGLFCDEVIGRIDTLEKEGEVSDRFIQAARDGFKK